jgi:hypothetical protein
MTVNSPGGTRGHGAILDSGRQELPGGRNGSKWPLADSPLLGVQDKNADVVSTVATARPSLNVGLI